MPGANEGGDEDVAMLMAQHGAARYADLETIDLCLDREPTPAPAVGKSPERVRGTLEP
ncbi:hypothetical protein [Actinomycetospora chiangmaiensis]|uniref:hypothetical protein n=1 Tax=Actinomycetospora chiangmaiensis TaxID=402650 RepID=UPI0003A7188E|nr:hypothetical protein [Actinomycetospora chiangmaiensis]